MNPLRRPIEIVQKEGVGSLFSAIYRFAWYRGGIDVELFFRSALNVPAKRTIRGTSMKFRVGSRDELKRITTFSGEESVISWFVREIQPGDIVWDVGANIGSYSLFARPHAKSVVAFEPHPANVERLEENASINGLNIDIRPIALSDTEGDGTLAVDEEHPSAGGGRISSEGAYEITLKKGAEVSPDPDVVKVDVEGHELSVLRGMEPVLDGIRTILVETHEGESVSQVRGFLESYGFESEARWQIGTRSFIVGSNSDDL